TSRSVCERGHAAAHPRPRPIADEDAPRHPRVCFAVPEAHASVCLSSSGSVHRNSARSGRQRGTHDDHVRLNGPTGRDVQWKMEDNSERRRDVRAHASPPAQIRRIKSSEPIEIVNASYRGLFIRTQGPPPQTSQLLRLRIELPTTVI